MRPGNSPQGATAVHHSTSEARGSWAESLKQNYPLENLVWYMHDLNVDLASVEPSEIQLFAGIKVLVLHVSRV